MVSRSHIWKSIIFGQARNHIRQSSRLKSCNQQSSLIVYIKPHNLTPSECMSPVRHKTKPISVFIKSQDNQVKRMGNKWEKIASSVVSPKLANCLKTVAESPKEDRHASHDFNIDWIKALSRSQYLYQEAGIFILVWSIPDTRPASLQTNKASKSQSRSCPCLWIEHWQPPPNGRLLQQSYRNIQKYGKSVDPNLHNHYNNLR